MPHSNELISRLAPASARAVLFLRFTAIPCCDAPAPDVVDHQLGGHRSQLHLSATNTSNSTAGDALATEQETGDARTFTYTLRHLNVAVAARGSRAVMRCEKFSTSMGRPNGANLCARSRGSGGVRPAASGAVAVAAARARGTADGIATEKAKSCIWHGAVKHAAAHLIITAPRLLEAHCSSNNVRLHQQWESMWNGVCGAASSELP